MAKACIQMLEDKEETQPQQGRGQRSGDETRWHRAMRLRREESAKALDPVVQRVKKSEPRKGQWFAA